jgi:hypothetical protein
MKRTSNTSKPDRSFGTATFDKGPDRSFGRTPVEAPLTNPAKELTDEIRDLRRKNKEFAATNEHDTYLVVSFSTKADRLAFLESVGLSHEHTMIDGYELARNVGHTPTKPSFELKKPILAHH